MPGERDDGRGGAEGFPGGLFRGEASRIAFGFADDLLAIIDFAFGEDAVDEAPAVFSDRAFDPRNFDYVYADACDHNWIRGPRSEIRDSRWSISLFVISTACGCWCATRSSGSASKTPSARASGESALCRR